MPTENPSSPSRKKKSSSKKRTKVINAGSFLSRIDTTLVQSGNVAGGGDDTTRAGLTERSSATAYSSYPIVDIEEQLQLNRQKEQERSRKQRKKIDD
ncbi:MAG: hypothetical protein SGILL_010477, partial [Bacillariaceae sp.]